MNSPRGPVGLVAALALTGALVLSGCSGDDSPEASSGSPSGSSSSSSSSTGSGSGSSSASASETPYLPVPDGVELTPQGSKLTVGDRAVVAYEPRQGQVGVLEIKVTRLERTTFKKSFVGWKLDAPTLRTSPYFVRATVRNVGAGNLGGNPVPLYIVDGRNTLIESSTFASTFDPCPSKPLPDKFRTGDRAQVCLVYLSPKKGDLTAVSFRPTQEFDPITWTGELQSPKAVQPARKPGDKLGGKKQR